MKKKWVAIIVVYFSFFTSNIFGQFTDPELKQIDSLNNIIKNTSSEDTAVVAAYISLGEILATSNIDTVIYFCEKARVKILSLLNTEKNQAKRKSLKISLAAALNNICYVHMNKVNLPLVAYERNNYEK